MKANIDVLPHPHGDAYSPRVAMDFADFDEKRENLRRPDPHVS